MRLYDRDGVRQTNEDKIANIVEEYYKQLYTSSNSRDVEDMIESVDQVATEGMAQSLTRTHTEEEVKTALFQMHPSKSPGPDGMSPFFFQKFWHIVLLLYYLFYTQGDT